MPKKKSYITATVQFCGAGGSSQGAEEAGAQIDLALNHWKLAIDTHSTNFPNARHDCTDISASDPRRYPSTDILHTSPECRPHTPAGGNNHKSLKKQMDLFNSGKIDPATERSRATMWDVPRFAEYHNYNIIIVENVVEAKTRWPLFDTWLTAMHVLGYNHKCLYFNSMHFFPTPQSRDRMYVVFWKKGNKAPNLDYTPSAYCPKCAKDILSVQTWKNSKKQFGKYRQQYVYCCPTCTLVVEPYYYAAFNIIDWNDRGVRIGDRKKPLKNKTMKRIRYGLDKFGPNPYLVQIAYGDKANGIVRGIHDPHYSQTTSIGQAIINPFIVRLEYGQMVKSASESLPVQTTRESMMLINPPFIIKGEHSFQEPQVRSVDDTLQTQVTRQTMGLLTPPFLIDLHSNGKAREIISETSTITAGGIKNGLVTTESWNCFLSAYYNGSHCVKHITEAIGTQTTNDRNSLVMYQNPEIEECFYRMLKAREVKLGMAFNENYVVLGNSRDQVKQCGNAVTPPVSKWLTETSIESLM